MNRNPRAKLKTCGFIFAILLCVVSIKYFDVCLTKIKRNIVSNLEHIGLISGPTYMKIFKHDFIKENLYKSFGNFGLLWPKQDNVNCDAAQQHNVQQNTDYAASGRAFTGDRVRTFHIRKVRYKEAPAAEHVKPLNSILKINNILRSKFSCRKWGVVTKFATQNVIYLKN